MHTLRYRQIHLDFHTSPAIPDVGAEFDKTHWQEALRLGHVDSITCFAVCHHGWNYNETKVGAMHPGLSFDLLRAQYDACKEIDVNVPVYITAGVSSRVAHEHPEWREISVDGRYTGWTSSPVTAGFESLCFNTPYLDYLCELIAETVGQYPQADGIFLDIIHQGPCCCRWCMDRMAARGLDPRKEADRMTNAEEVLMEYYRRSTEAARSANPEMPVFHNSGHIPRGKRDILPFFSHLEIESLPTGGWGYDHFPVSAKYCKKLDLDFMGMTGKFHTTWGEFGGYKHPNALRYECAAMLAYGAKCSVGDQLHPNGKMDLNTYRIIGEAYAEVRRKEPWCAGTRNVAVVGLLSSEALGGGGEQRKDNAADTGAARVLLEEHILFDVLDARMDFAPYRLLILPDEIPIDDALRAKLDSYLAGGGKLLLTGSAGLDGDEFLFDPGAKCEGLSPYQPDYAAPIAELSPSFVQSPFVMYLPSRRIKVSEGSGAVSLGAVYDPYFNRSYEHFCSHQHAPARPDPSGYSCGVRNGAGNIVYLAHPVFSLYRAGGQVACREYAAGAIRMLLGDEDLLRTTLPSTARVSLMGLPDERGYVLHLLYANTVGRGGSMKLSDEGFVRDTQPVEVIEELLPLHQVQVSLRMPEGEVKRVVLEPEGREIRFDRNGDRIDLVIDRLVCHQMVVFERA